MPHNEFVFTLKDFIQVLVLAGSAGGILTQVRQHTKQIDKLYKRTDRIEEKMLKAVEDLGTNIASLTTELKTVLAVHDTRLTNIEKDKH